MSRTAPGGAALTELSLPVTVTGIGTQTVELGTPPAGTTAIYIASTCLTAGEFTFADGRTYGKTPIGEFVHRGLTGDRPAVDVLITGGAQVE